MDRKPIAKKHPTHKKKHTEETNTSWGGVASWYNDHLEKGDDTYHKKVILPNLLRIIDTVKGKHILDLACGQGYFALALEQAGAFVTGVDISKELIAQAEANQKDEKNPSKKVLYCATPSNDLYMIKDNSQDIVVCVLALQNIEDIDGTFKEVKRVLKKEGRFIAIINHPSFRNPRETHWGYDEHTHAQYRRVDAYLSESKVKMDMTPGSKDNKKFTVSFHRPLQFWSKRLYKHKFLISRMEEWESHKVSERGPRQNAENKARKEIPLFLMIEAVH